MRAGLIAALIAVGSGAAATAADDAKTPDYYQELDRQTQEDERREAVWRQRWQQHVTAEKQAEQRLAAATAAHDKLGHQHDYRGQTRSQILTEQAQAQEALERARKELQDFYDEAHRAGIPPGWVGHPD